MSISSEFFLVIFAIHVYVRRSCETKAAEFVFIVRRPHNAADVCRRIFAAMTTTTTTVAVSSPKLLCCRKSIPDLVGLYFSAAGC